MISIPKGTRDVLPADSYKWHYIENLVKNVAVDFNIREIRTPVFEHTELFLRGVGNTTDVVSKEMYTFTDKGDRSMTLKPEGTAGVARSYLENGLVQLAAPVKMFYIAPVFRYERPQAGRLREHHQFGVEMYGSALPSMDAEVIGVAAEIFKRLGVTDLSLNINSIGCPKCRGGYNEALRAYYGKYRDKLCRTCLDRLDKNPLRILDCKEEDCIEINKHAPVIFDYLCEECCGHFDMLKNHLTVLGIEYSVDPRIVRGLDYYTKTVFEFVSSAIGAKGTVCGGGRYDGLVESIGGKPTPAVGFGMGLERLMLQLEACGIEIPNEEKLSVFVVSCDESCYPYAFKLAAELRSSGISTDIDHGGRSMKAQFKFADKLGAQNVIVVGSEEMASGILTVKDMSSGEQRKTARENIVSSIVRR